MEIDRNRLTPMMKQYFECKDKYPDCILFFRLGDFYEMFFEDAIVASKTLEIALTGKSCGLDERAPMCGIPFHAANSYISKLVESGYKVAIGEQMEDPQTAKGIVKREVIRVVTPGTVLEGNLLENKKNNYLMSLYKIKDKIGLSYVDISTGEANATIIGKDKVIEEIAKISPSEIILNDISFKEDLKNIATVANIYINESFEDKYLDLNILNEYFHDDYLQTLKFDEDNFIKKSLCILLNYIYNTQKQITSNINHVNIYNPMEYMVLDMFTRINLEITQTIRGSKKKGSLLHVLDKTSTAMGGRLLRKYVEEPLVNKERIDERLNVIEEIKNDFSFREDLIEILKNVYDIERICGKIAFEKVTPKEMIHLKNSIEKLPPLKDRIDNCSGDTIKKYIDNMEDLNDIYELINKAIREEPSLTIKDGNIIKSSYNEELSELRNISKNGAFMIKEIENREKEKTGVKSLKIGFNKVFGYYIEITKANLVNLDLEGRYIRKQTLSNAERYITEELKEIEDKILHAEEKIKALEYDLFVKIRQTIYSNIDRIQNVAKIIANIDVFTSFATVAHINNYVKPDINNSSKLDIKNGRHPVIENIVGEQNFVPNDTYLNRGENNINIITGPNMSGKSTYMRQTAIICLMAHIGSFVPADSANIPISDRIFTRVGASDDLSQGQSTFMVEMSEVSHILKNATEKSLVILDEIGRGTSTYDGISLAWSIVEYIENNIKCKTLFATHYHELTELENEFKEVKNYSIAVKDDGENIIFLRKIIDQAADKSYGIYVAKLAKLPDEVINRSSEILKDLEKNHIYNGYAINGNVNNVAENVILDKKNYCSIVEGSVSEIELELKKLEESNLKNEFETLKIENDNLSKTFKKLKKDYDKVNEEVEKLNNKLSEEVAVSVDQISFDTVNDSNIIDEITSLDILSMTPLDAMNALFNLQRKVKK
ncbi:MAG: DNA mismatch repair protein MutS [Terrisporobacter sp.]